KPWDRGKRGTAPRPNQDRPGSIHTCTTVCYRLDSATVHFQCCPQISMARKTKQETQATRDGILDAAEACFQENGIAATSLEKIAVRAGFTRGAVYWHFKNKAEVLAAVITRCRVP